MVPRLIPLMAALLLALLLISACGETSPTPAETQAPPTVTRTKSPTKTITPTLPKPIGIEPAALKGLKIEVWQAFAGGAAEVFARQVEQFNAANEWGIQVHPTGYSDYPGLFDALNAALEAGAAPDLAAALPEQILAWAAEKSVADLTPYLADPAWGMNAQALADIPPVFRTQDNVNGTQWGFPAERSARFLFYNETWAQELGFESPPTTTAEFRRQACAANAYFRTDNSPTNDSYGGWIVGTDWETGYDWLLAFDGGVEDGGSYGFRTDPNLASLKFLKKLYEDNCAWLPLEPASFNRFDAFARRLGLFVSADLAEIPQAAASMSALKNADQWKLIPFPGQEKPVLVTYGPSYAVMKTTPEKQLAAWVFMRWLLAPENQAQWVTATGLLPLRMASMDSLATFRAARPQWEGAVGALDLAQNVPQLASWRKVKYVIGDGLSTIFQNNTPEGQLPSILTEMDALAQQMNK
jgi:ABC-type glycerol-3-phosphate transport system substrate-binding protein